MIIEGEFDADNDHGAASEQIVHGGRKCSEVKMAAARGGLRAEDHGSGKRNISIPIAYVCDERG